jgi:hypothetical protein
MNKPEPRFRVLYGLSARALAKQIRECEEEGWKKLGSEAVAVPADPARPPYLCQTMYFEAEAEPNGVSLAERLEGHTPPSAVHAALALNIRASSPGVA